MKLFLINPMLVAAVGAVGWIGCRLAGVNPHVWPMMAAALMCLFAAEASISLLVWQRPTTTLAATQAALLALGVHLFLSVMVAIVSLLVFRGDGSIVWWLLAMFWTTLLGVCGSLILAVRAVKPPAAVDRGL